MSANTDKDSQWPDMVSVPRRATKEMIAAAYWASLDDDIAGVWEAMVEAALRCEQREIA